MHLWEGLLLFDRTRGILYSSDLFMGFGDLAAQVQDSSLEEELGGISREQIPHDRKKEELKRALRSLMPGFIAPGHGACKKLV